MNEMDDSFHDVPTSTLITSPNVCLMIPKRSAICRACNLIGEQLVVCRSSRSFRFVNGVLLLPITQLQRDSDSFRSALLRCYSLGN